LIKDIELNNFNEEKNESDSDSSDDSESESGDEIVVEEAA